MFESGPRVETRDAMFVLVQRHVVPMAEVQQAMAKALPAAFAACTANGWQMTGPPMTRYPDPSMGGPTMTLESGLPVAGPVEAPEGLDVVQTTAGPVAVFIHRGIYETLGQTWQAAFGWVGANGRTLAGAPWESYLTDPGSVPDPADWVTEVCLPLQPTDG